jgi:hypothetical protein
MKAPSLYRAIKGSKRCLQNGLNKLSLRLERRQQRGKGGDREGEEVEAFNLVLTLREVCIYRTML